VKRTAAAAQEIRAPDERDRAINAVLDSSMYPDTGGITLWRASQLARQHGKTVDTGYANLSAELPGGGWPAGALIELLVQQTGVGEIRLLQPAALKAVAKRPIVLIKPPHLPNATGFSYIGVPIDKIMVLQAEKTSDALWSVDQVLKAGTCGAVLLWQQHIRGESLRRLALSAASAETLLFVVRPLAARQDSSPATLRLAITPSVDGVSVDIVKRKGPIGTGPFNVVLQPSPALISPRGRVNSRPRKIVRGAPTVAPAAV
jgi:protein ImuA